MIVLEWLFLTIAPCDAAEPWQLGSQDAATPIMQGITDLHHDVFFFVILILVFVSWILGRALWHFHYKKNPIPQRIVHGTTIEILRTIFPSIIPMFIAIPSFALLYSMDEVVVDPAITIKAIGHQWYRTYEYSDYNSSDEQSLTFDSYTIPEDDPELGQSRLLEVDNRVVVPAKSYIRFIVTSADVPDSWAVPSLGVKCDAVPGRLNQTSISVQREGVYYGQCSEICGTNHAFMPIVVEAVPRKDYGSRVSNQLIPQTADSSPIFIGSPNPKKTLFFWGDPSRGYGEQSLTLAWLWAREEKRKPTLT
uniref:Cytochrome c oxidase subunit 2 n=1 Tax=Petunia hybrida TaxID=4102 RepID=Q99032_PETHY|nr:mitochondrial cytochrome oxidase subunit II [Petunia x hybrida]prf//2106323A cytochrome c oxidase:SUBUNIT=II [Petunia x hybrida]